MLQEPHNLLFTSVYAKWLHTNPVHCGEVNLREVAVRAWRECVDELTDMLLGNNNLVD